MDNRTREAEPLLAPADSYKKKRMTRREASLRNLLRNSGHVVFRCRFALGLLMALIALEWIEPAPPFSPGNRLVHGSALVLIAVGLVLRGWASGCAGTHTRTDRIDAPRLVTGGPFAHVRNPIYAGTIIISAGMVLLIGDVRAMVVAALTLTLLFYAIIPAEEAFLLGRFGDEYRRYCQAVPRWLPQWRPWPEAQRPMFRWRGAYGELLVAGALLFIYVALLVEEYFDRLGYH